MFIDSEEEKMDLEAHGDFPGVGFGVSNIMAGATSDTLQKLRVSCLAQGS